jgi:hypothetical protein
MHTVLALLQNAAAPDNKMLFILLGVITLAALFALGLKFFTNMFEVITAPGASLGHIGRTDNFFFGFTIIVLAGLIGTLILMMSLTQMQDGFNQFSSSYATSAAQGNANATYRDIAASYGTMQLDNFFSVYVASNLVFYPIVAVIIWLLVSIVLFGIVRVIGGQITAGAFLSMLAYPYFFGVIGVACMAAGLLPDLKGLIGGSPAIGVFTIIGALLFLYSLILTMIGINQGAECGPTRMIISLIILLVLLGGGGYAGAVYGVQPALDKFNSDVKGFDPSKENFQLPS